MKTKFKCLNVLLLIVPMISCSTVYCQEGVNFDKESWSNTLAKAKAENKIVFVDAYTTWCGPCKVLSPILEELEAEVEDVQFVKLDVDQFPEIAGANQVMGVPTVVILKDGEVKERFVGVQPKETIKDKITALS